jgi:hypothetical protein
VTLSQPYDVSEEFRAWVRDGIRRRARWLLIFSDLVDNIDFCDFCDDDVALELERAADAADGSEVRLTGIYALHGTEAEIIRRAQGRAAAA